MRGKYFVIFIKRSLNFLNEELVTTKALDTKSDSVTLTKTFSETFTTFMKTKRKERFPL